MDVIRQCRHCGHLLQTDLIDLGKSPLCQTFLTYEQLDEMEPFYPLQVKVCDNCWLVQVGEYVTPAELFANYEYYSSYSTAWLEHARSRSGQSLRQYRARTRPTTAGCHPQRPV